MASNFSASIPASEMQAANTTLENAGHGPNNFSVPAYNSPTAGVALLHAWGDPEFEAAVATILTAQTIGTSYADSTDHAGLIIINRDLTAQETTDVTAWLTAKGATA